MKKLFSTIHKKSFRDVILSGIASSYIHEKNEQLVRIRGHRMAVYANDWIGMKVYLEGVYEKEEIQDVFDLFDFLNIDLSNSSAIDVGANIGNHTVSFSKRFNKVFAFEPNPHTFKLLNFNADYLASVFTYNVGLSDENRILLMSENATNYGASSTVFKCESNSNVEIEVKTLDSFFFDANDIKLIKIDVEGMEYKVLLGAEKTIIRNKPIIVFEQSPADFDEELNETKSIKFLRKNDYDIFCCHQSHANRSWISRRLKNLYELFFGRTIVRNIVKEELVLRDAYLMLIAIPRST